MLKSIQVRNFALIGELDLSTGPGLTVFTGETGAGKSILIEALGFALGARASADLIKTGTSQMEVTVEFDSAPFDKREREVFGMGAGGFSLRRSLDSKGRGRAFIGNRPVPVSTLAAIGQSLVDFHGQHEHQTLLRAEAHRQLLDRFGGLEKQVSAIGAVFRERQAVLSRMEAARMSAGEKERLLDLYRYQLQEITEAAIKPGEDAALEIELPKARNAGKLRELADAAHGLLYSRDGAAVEKTGGALKMVAELAALDPALSEPAQQLAQAATLIEDVAATLGDYKDGISMDPAQLDALLSRHERLLRLKKKYGPELSDVFSTAESLKVKISDLERSDDTGQDLRAEAEKLGKKYSALAAELHDKRAAAAGKLSALVLKEIRPLGFPEVKFGVCVELDEAGGGADGADSVEFLFSPNPGEPARPLKNIASGGEMSRVMLGLKTVLASADRVPVLVFDEVDAGIGGIVGRLVGEKLARLGGRHQVFCVTHLAQVAGCADAHFRVEKAARGASTSVAVEKISGEARICEIARMLGGRKEISQAGIKHAQELLSECAGQKGDDK